jgi:hypothetical protein
VSGSRQDYRRSSKLSKSTGRIRKKPIISVSNQEILSPKINGLKNKLIAETIAKQTQAAIYLIKAVSKEATIDEIPIVVIDDLELSSLV